MTKLNVAIVAILIAVGASGLYASAQESTLTDEQIEQIRNTCTSTQAALRLVHTTDALARVNLGQQYEAVSSRLLAPMNSRIALNKLDGVSLAQITVDFNKEFEYFRKTLYPQYENTRSTATSMSCYDQPVEFFDTLNLALERRAKVRQSTEKLAKLLDDYQLTLNTLEQSIKSEAKQ